MFGLKSIWMVTFACCMAANGCGGDGGGSGGEGGTGNSGGGGTPTGAQGGGGSGDGCSGDAECDDDGAYCNGAPKCVDGVCKNQPIDCGEAPEGCTGVECSESKKRCVPVPFDADSDGHGAPGCPGGAIKDDDCDDDNENRYPGNWDGPLGDGNSDRCNDGIDQDCTGTPDDGSTQGGATCTCAAGQSVQMWVYDGDRDNHGLLSSSIDSCAKPSQCPVNQPGCTDTTLWKIGIPQDDCDDTDSERHPGFAEQCDGKDNNCNGPADEVFLDLGDSCDNELVGVCHRANVRTCKSNGLGTECNVSSAAPDEAFHVTVDSATSSWDYNCNGAIERRYERTADNSFGALNGVFHVVSRYDFDCDVFTDQVNCVATHYSANFPGLITESCGLTSLYRHTCRWDGTECDNTGSPYSLGAQGCK
ncbi:putative metal-binding motif-containing protein [Sorangium cellulosum]|uniref:putative metal-binding motif-containing protein n=1 Tax=Sorangium cellulosum TaxID=56 RepID=UPI00133141B0|nr:putative metal-binding motif-containing protein [Sorangium cellulosum]